MRIKGIWAVFLMVMLFPLTVAAADAKPQYFTNVRDAHPTSGVNYVVVDPEIWAHSRSDLADVRLYNGTQELPYALREQGSVAMTEPHAVKVLNKGTIPDATTFVLDMSGVDEYDEITLDLNHHDFNTLAAVSGANTADAKDWTALTSSPIFDFTKQKLGASTTIALPASTWRFLRVEISSKVRGNEIVPEMITGAKARNTERTTAIWDDIGVSIPRGQNPHESVLEIEVPKGVPVDRIHFSVPAERVNFRREITIESRPDDKKFKADDEGWEPVVTGEISRVRYVVDKVHEALDIPTHGTHAMHWRVTIRNGDDLPLPVELKAQSLERRLYFDAQGSRIIRVYYGDEKLPPPVYDYAKFFRDADARNAVEAKLGPAMDNPEHADRPDDRPWTERNNWVLWTAMIVAILGIGLVALRGLRRA